MVRDSHSSRTGWNLYLTWDYGASAAEVKLLCDPTGNCAYGNGEFHAVIQESTDGGKTWQKVLYKDENTGAVDLVFDPTNPHILYAALYQVRREPWTLTSGGPGSGIYKSTDEGATWTQLKGNGLPEGLLGRIGLAVGVDSNTVYALIEAKKGGLYVSQDGGGHWEFVTGDHRLMQRPWYFTQIFADPKNTDTIYVLNVRKIVFNFGMQQGLVLAPSVSVRDVVVIVLMVVLMALLASLQPAWKASRMDPVRALSHV